ncbi:MAG TPA: LysR family transcriptional regulator, partial [Noviherbaspirillum sp.]|nr:LysR family transcriptional regulator [Noviherbaspirillum sp.]
TIINLVTAGVGLALLREDVALSVAASNELVLWENGSRKSTLSFVHLKERGDEPAIAGATEIVREVWVG